MKTLRTFIAEVVDDMGLVEIGPSEAAELVEDHVRATRDWLAQPEIVAIMLGGVSESGTAAGAALALRREAVK